jgi:hypothetical protein
VLIVIPRAFSSGALSIGVVLGRRQTFGNTVVIAVVNVVFP